jgi:hypothetical protein
MIGIIYTIKSYLILYTIDPWKKEYPTPATRQCQKLSFLMYSAENSINFKWYFHNALCEKKSVHHLCHTCICVFRTCFCGRGFGFKIRFNGVFLRSHKNWFNCLDINIDWLFLYVQRVQYFNYWIYSGREQDQQYVKTI